MKPEFSKQELDLQLLGMSCVNCAGKIEKTLNALPDVQAEVNFATEKAHIKSTKFLDVEHLIQVIQNIGYQAFEVSDDLRNPEGDLRVQEEFARDQRHFLIALILTLPFAAEMIAMFWRGSHEHLLPPLWQWALATPVQFWLGFRFYRGAFHALKSRSANMDVLVALGTSMAYLLSVVVILKDWHHNHLYFEASASVITLILLGKLLESRAKGKTSEAVESLIRLQPATAFVKSGQEFVEVPLSEVRTGDTVLVKNGESFPVDGTVLEGRSTVDESMLTGESVPVEKSPGSAVFAATLNQEGSLQVHATSVGGKTQLAQIVKIVTAAQGSKAPIQKMADRISSVFVPVVVFISVLTFFGTGVFTSDWNQAFVSAVSVLVIACPCALGLATPTAVVVGIGRAAQAGILFRDAKALELAEKTQIVIFDKTGTITEGRPRLQMIKTFGAFPEENALAIAASLEESSSHPLAQALVMAARNRNLEIERITDFKATAGEGMEARWREELYFAGRPQWLKTSHSLDFSIIEEMEKKGESVVVLASQSEVIAYFGIADRIRESSKSAIAKLRAQGVEVLMLTGDNEGAAREIARQAGIDNYKSHVSPSDKAHIVLTQKRKKKIVAMVGDGINDAPALALADVSFSMASGTDIAMESADITLMHNDLESLVQALELSRMTLGKIKQNLFFAFIYNVLGIPLAALGLLNPIIAGTAMALSSVSVITNSLLLKRKEIHDSSAINQNSKTSL